MKVTALFLALFVWGNLASAEGDRQQSQPRPFTPSLTDGGGANYTVPEKPETLRLVGSKMGMGKEEIRNVESRMQFDASSIPHFMEGLSQNPNKEVIVRTLVNEFLRSQEQADYALPPGYSSTLALNEALHKYFPDYAPETRKRMVKVAIRHGSPDLVAKLTDPKFGSVHPMRRAGSICGATWAMLGGNEPGIALVPVAAVGGAILVIVDYRLKNFEPAPSKKSPVKEKKEK